MLARGGTAAGITTAIVTFTRDLRPHDNPALYLACSRARQVVPLFVQDSAIPAPPNRARFLAEALGDLRQQLRERGARRPGRAGYRPRPRRFASAGERRRTVEVDHVRLIGRLQI